MIFSEKLQLIRKNKGLTQEELAKASGVSMCAINFIETGKKNPRPNTLIKIAKVLEVEADELLQYILD